MSALRKAGVWLGLVEDDDEREYDDRGYNASAYRDRSSSAYRDGRRATARDDYDVDYDDEEDEEELPSVPRSRYADRMREERSSREERAPQTPAGRPDSRYESGRGSTVRPITRPSTAGSAPAAPTGSTGRSGGLFGSRDSLALAPESEPAAPPPSRVVATPDEDRRYQITTLHPTTYNEARTIGEHFRDGTPVIMNLTEMDEADAKRLVDFAAGLAFGLRGTIERVTHRVFLLSPANVTVTAEEKAKIAEGGYHHS
ncbi:cell division protein SepF [Hamadaea tsunoensis]|uniref:cell division protein SepF n=1 Tax=Hamadaea tsunoensis TaxID=53368 RepID=UPI000481FE89|nr:cell division protein SepF [Hamadaea tsunoensis]